MQGVKLLRDESEAQLLFDEQVRERASWLRVRMQMVHEVADRTAEAEDTDTRLKELTSNKKLCECPWDHLWLPLVTRELAHNTRQLV